MHNDNDGASDDIHLLVSLLVTLALSRLILCFHHQGVSPSGESTGKKSSALRVLAIPELISSILCYCANHELAMSAVVCKRWEFSALRILWHTITDARYLFRLLGALTRSSDSSVGPYVLHSAVV